MAESDRKPRTERQYKVYDHDGFPLHVGPDPDGLDCVEISSPPCSKDQYGELRLCVHPDMAEQIAKAILCCVNDLRAPAEKEDRA